MLDTKYQLGHYNDHAENCLLQKNVIPGWCTCTVNREIRIQTIVDFAMGDIDEPYAYYDVLQDGELAEAISRIRKEVEVFNPIYKESRNFLLQWILAILTVFIFFFLY